MIERVKAFFDDHTIRFEVVCGDLFYQYQNRDIQIRNTVGNFATRFMRSRKFLDKDMLAILQVVDTDGCFISSEYVTVEPGQNQSTLYNLEYITVSDECQRDRIIMRNQKRSRNIEIMCTTKNIKNIPYKLYYFSRNLEHVIFNDPNPNDDEKYGEIVAFLERNQVPVEALLAEYMPNLVGNDLDSRYIKSWEFIREGLNSLHRNTNVPLLFEHLSETADEKEIYFQKS